MPGALGRRPDFFSAISPEHYSDLKRGYKDKKDGDPVYKDVGTTEGDRDFVHTASCSKMSGECNKNVEKDSYKKGDFVAPEDLNNMWSALEKELNASSPEQEGGGLPSLGATRSQIAREKAMEAARSLSGENVSGNASTVSGSGPVPTKIDATPVGQAVASARRLWKNATSLALPGSTSAEREQKSRLLLVALGVLIALGGFVLFLRRKG